MPTPKWKQKAEEINGIVDAKADEQLDKLKESRFTALILGAVSLILAGILYLLASY